MFVLNLLIIRYMPRERGEFFNSRLKCVVAAFDSKGRLFPIRGTESSVAVSAGRWRHTQVVGVDGT